MSRKNSHSLTRALPPHPPTVRERMSGLGVCACESVTEKPFNERKAMTSFTMFGHSDDLFRVTTGDGLIYEAGAYDRDVYVAFSDGTLVKGYYNSPGIWEIIALYVGHHSADEHVSASLNPDSDYTDTLTITGNATVAACWTAGVDGDVEHVKPIARKAASAQRVIVRQLMEQLP